MQNSSDLKLLTGGDVIWKGELRHGHALLFSSDSNKILACLPDDKTRELDVLNGAELEKIDVSGLCVCPGFINVHVHGSHGFDTMDAASASDADAVAALDGLSLAMAREGTTAFLPTTVAAPMPELERVVEVTRKLMIKAPGAALLGIHLEGPWLDVQMRGAHFEKFLSSRPDAEWVSERADVIRTVSFAPTLDPSHEFLRRLLDVNVIPSLAHTTATCDEALDAIKAGAKSITHLFNAQRGLHHRAPGMIGAAAISDVMCELIADGHHIDARLFAPLCRMIGTDRLILITDAMRAAGLPDGEYDFCGGQVRVKNGLPVQPDGTIAGSALRMNQAVKIFSEAAGIHLTEAVAMASRNPAKLHGLSSHKGELAPGMDADITCLDINHEFDVKMTFVNGMRVV